MEKDLILLEDSNLITDHNNMIKTRASPELLGVGSNCKDDPLHLIFFAPSSQTRDSSI